MMSMTSSFVDWCSSGAHPSFLQRLLRESRLAEPEAHRSTSEVSAALGPNQFFPQWIEYPQPTDRPLDSAVLSAYAVVLYGLSMSPSVGNATSAPEFGGLMPKLVRLLPSYGSSE